MKSHFQAIRRVYVAEPSFITQNGFSKLQDLDHSLKVETPSLASKILVGSNQLGYVSADIPSDYAESTFTSVKQMSTYLKSKNAPTLTFLNMASLKQRTEPDFAFLA